MVICPFIYILLIHFENIYREHVKIQYLASTSDMMMRRKKAKRKLPRPPWNSHFSALPPSARQDALLASSLLFSLPLSSVPKLLGTILLPFPPTAQTSPYLAPPSFVAHTSCSRKYVLHSKCCSVC